MHRAQMSGYDVEPSGHSRDRLHAQLLLYVGVDVAGLPELRPCKVQYLS